MIRAIKIFSLACTILAICEQTPFPASIAVSQGILLDVSSIRPICLNEIPQFESLDAELLIYGYSTGKEIFTLTDQGLQIQSVPGEILGMIKIRSGGSLKKVLFIKGTGNTPRELVTSMIEALKKELEPFLS